MHSIPATGAASERNVNVNSTSGKTHRHTPRGALMDKGLEHPASEQSFCRDSPLFPGEKNVWKNSKIKLVKNKIIKVHVKNFYLAAITDV